MDTINQKNEAAARHIYLPIAEGEIRLIRLHAAAPDGPIACSLLPTPQSTAPSYEALSYVWGSQQHSYPISLNGYAFHVTQNLFQALRYLRLPTADRLLWVDALAIDQGNDAEKSEQVLLMHTIYSGGKETIAWLGEGDEHVDAAICFFCLRTVSKERSVLAEDTRPRSRR